MNDYCWSSYTEEDFDFCWYSCCVYQTSYQSTEDDSCLRKQNLKIWAKPNQNLSVYASQRFVSHMFGLQRLIRVAKGMPCLKFFSLRFQLYPYSTNLWLIKVSATRKKLPPVFFFIFINYWPINLLPQQSSEYRRLRDNIFLAESWRERAQPKCLESKDFNP